MHAILGEHVYLVQGSFESLNQGIKCRIFQPALAMKYTGFCDDFGPVNMASVVDFIKLLHSEIEAYPTSKIVFVVNEGRRHLTNAVFLLGAYMILQLNMSASKVSETFSWLDSTKIEPYRDATFSKPDFHLHLIDCWRGLEKGQALGWIRYASSGYMWGRIDVEQYSHYDNGVNGNLHHVVPGKFVAFQGPQDLAGAEYRDHAYGGRDFSPSFYLPIFHDMGVTDVVRLNEPHYAAEAFASHGLRHHAMEFDDCTCPPDHVVAAFLRAADAAPGAVAVHCRAGLGRTGTLIALYMMRSYGFTAREAMGWLRIMRPGSVIGEQQRYLCRVGAAAAAVHYLRAKPGSAAAAAAAAAIADAISAAGCGGAAAPATSSPAAMAAEVEKGMRRRCAGAAAAETAAGRGELRGAVCSAVVGGGGGIHARA
jgi:cell division cycle 14